jgi:chromosome segregation ATPase
LRQAEKSFETGDYAKAAEAYEAYFRDNPSRKNQDRALFRLALAYSFPNNPAHDVQQAVRVLRQLISQFPQSPYALQAKVILSFHEEIERLSLDITQREDRVKLLSSDLDQLKREVDKLRADVRERETRIRFLSNELEQLKKIDMERRPPRPPG